ncbi:hypothetical protein Pfo_000433 [Paulownia fortunei]|nr:hypothetical protein Pfo_000433 [Paulownia fortunei]
MHIFVTRITPITWLEPAQGWIKLNSDGASKGNPGIAGAGGLLRNWNGDVLVAFYEAIGVQTNSVAELHAVLRGLMLAIERGFTRIWIEVDSKLVVQLLTGNSMANWTHQSFITRDRSLLRGVEYKITHLLREGNKVADCLANMACILLDSNVFQQNNIPNEICGLVKADTLKLTSFRFKNVYC